MMYPSPAQPKTAHAARAAQSRGSALVLALVTVVMLLMLGAAYLQVARTDRRTARDVDLRTNDSNGSILRYIGGILEGDIPRKAVGGDNEFFDYPYSNNAITRVVEDRYAPITVPGPVPNLANGDLPAREPRASTPLNDAAGILIARGGRDDDPWLASSQPDFVNISTYNGQPAYYWPHISDLSGVFLDLGDVGPGRDTTGNGQNMPAQYLSTALGTALSPITAGAEKASGVAYAVPAIPEADVLAIDEGRFADADDDGILDSRWTWAPLPSEGGQAYVMAVRVVDNSALINLNVWDYFSSLAASNDPPRGLFPNDLDLETAIATLNTRSQSGPLAAAQVTSERGLGNAPDHDRRLYAWLKSHVSADAPAGWATIGTTRENNATGFDDTTDPGDTHQKFALNANEIELRWRGGLNRTTNDNASAFPPSPLEDLPGAAGFFRQADLEQDYKDTSYGNVTLTVPNDADNIFSLFFNEPRRWLTVLSGSAEFARVSLSEADEDDLIELFDVAAANRPQLYERTAGAPDGPFWDNDNDYPAQLAAVVQDYRDANNRLTGVDVDDSPNTVYGMEYLPFISEVYVQARYEATVVAPGDPVDVRWDFTGSHVVIEFVNPWPWEVSVPDIQLVIDGTTVPGVLSDPAALDQTMGPHEQKALVLRDREGPAGPLTLPTGVSGQDVTIDQWPDADGANANGGVVEIELRAPIDGGGEVLYQRFAAARPPEIVNEFAVPAADMIGTAPNDEGYMYWSTRGTGDGLAALTVRRNELDPQNDRLIDAAGLPPAEGAAAIDLSVDARLGEHEKRAGFDIDSDSSTGTQPNPRVADAYGEADFPGRPAGGTGATGAVTARHEPFQIANTGRVYRAAEIMRMVFLGPRREAGNDLSIAQVWDRFPKDANGSFLVSSLMLQPRQADNTLDEPTVGLLASVTAFEENLGLIPGRLNINTAPDWLIAAALPLADPAARAAVAADLVAERDAGPNPGIEYLGDLLSNTYTALYNSAAPAPSRDQVPDFNEPEESLGPDTAGGYDHDLDGFNLDAEERLALFSFINQMVHTRSDVFTAYVVVRAYPANDFLANNPTAAVAEPTRSYRLIAVFDRSSGKWRVRAVKRIEQ